MGILNDRDAEIRGAKINVRTKVISAEQSNGIWHLTLQSLKDNTTRIVKARLIVNAGGPWVEDIIQNTVRLNSSEGVRLVRGSHLITILLLLLLLPLILLLLLLAVLLLLLAQYARTRQHPDERGHYPGA